MAPMAGAAALLLTTGAALERRFLYPDRGLNHEALFDELARDGFEWNRFVDRAPTLRIRLDRLDEVQSLFGRLDNLARKVFAWAEERGRLRLDWFAGRGWQGGTGSKVPGLDGPGKASDHAPIRAEFE